MVNLSEQGFTDGETQRMSVNKKSDRVYVAYLTGMFRTKTRSSVKTL